MRRTAVLSLTVVLFYTAASVSFSQTAGTGTASGGGAPQKDVPMIASSGKVLETMVSGGYTYIFLQEKDGGKRWFAVPETKVKVGDEISVRPGVEMQKFSSKSLGKTFDRIIFSIGVVDKMGVAPSTMTGTGKPAQVIFAGDKAPHPIPGVTAIKKPSKRDEYTIAQVFAKRKSLKGKTVTVRGKVVKVTTGIMKRNWIHIQDGTGKKKKKTDTLVVTSTTLPAEGDVVTIQGILASDRDFGAGYKYDAIVENATVTKN